MIFLEEGIRKGIEALNNPNKILSVKNKLYKTTFEYKILREIREDTISFLL